MRKVWQSIVKWWQSLWASPAAVAESVVPETTAEAEEESFVRTRSELWQGNAEEVDAWPDGVWTTLPDSNSKVEITNTTTETTRYYSSFTWAGATQTVASWTEGTWYYSPHATSAVMVTNTTDGSVRFYNEIITIEGSTNDNFELGGVVIITAATITNSSTTAGRATALKIIRENPRYRAVYRQDNGEIWPANINLISACENRTGRCDMNRIEI